MFLPRFLIVRSRGATASNFGTTPSINGGINIQMGEFWYVRMKVSSITLQEADLRCIGGVSYLAPSFPVIASSSPTFEPKRDCKFGTSSSVSTPTVTFPGLIEFL